MKHSLKLTSTLSLTDSRSLVFLNYYSVINVESSNRFYLMARAAAPRSAALPSIAEAANFTSRMLIG